MSDLGQAVAFATGLWKQRAAIAAAGHLLRDPMAQLHLRPGRENPYAIYDRMRAAGPMLPTRLGNWSTTSHAVCDSVLRDRRFGVRPAGNGAPGKSEEFNLSFLDMNPPDHTRLRRLAQPSFSPKATATYRDRIERTVDALLVAAAAAGRFDLMAAYAAPLPIAVITDLLGIPDADAEEFARYGRVIGSALDGIQSVRHAARLEANDAKLRVLFEGLFALRRREPADDIVSRIVAAEGDQVQPEEMLPMCMLLLVAGYETTMNLIGNAVMALLNRPEQWQALCDDPVGLAPKAVEEALRFDSPVQRTSRVALEPVELAGCPVHKGQWVITLIGGANRDPDVYERPDVFDLHRDRPVEHLAFSSGIHYCVGQPLARLEATIALQVLAQRLPGLRLAGPVRRRNATTIRGPLRLPVTTISARPPGARQPMD
jgi:P450-derived glycosyltransferase activator